MQENTLKSELNSMISNNHSSEPSMAQKDARDDFDSIKEQIKFAVSQQDYYTSSDGLHEVTVMFPPYPNTTQYCYLREYLTLTKDVKRYTTGLFKKSSYTKETLYCKPINQDKFEDYKKEFSALCEKENITYKFVVTPIAADRSRASGLSNSYKIVPGCIETDKNFISYSYTIRILATMAF